MDLLSSPSSSSSDVGGVGPDEFRGVLAMLTPRKHTRLQCAIPDTLVRLEQKVEKSRPALVLQPTLKPEMFQ